MTGYQKTLMLITLGFYMWLYGELKAESIFMVMQNLSAVQGMLMALNMDFMTLTMSGPSVFRVENYLKKREGPQAQRRHTDDVEMMLGDSLRGLQQLHGSF